MAGATNISLRREGDRFVTDQGPADDERTRGLIERLSSILATTVVGYGPPPNHSGLASPRARVVISRADGAPAPREITLLIGSARGEAAERKVFVKRDDLDVTFEVPAMLVDAILGYRP
ncbi:MAG: hypothetical protein H5U40_13290 [Polyangiaceae bacterium]|nr:hypothetical protein [Polyangiaceae bacterium]